MIRWLLYRQRGAKIALEALSIRDEAERSATWFASFSRKERENLFAPEFLVQVDIARIFESYMGKQREPTPLKRMLHADRKVWLPDNLLLRGDVMTMAASIEERVSFLGRTRPLNPRSAVECLCSRRMAAYSPGLLTGLDKIP